MHFGYVKKGVFIDGKRVSVNKKTKEMRLVNTKHQSDGSKLQKIQSFTSAGASSGLYRDGVRVGKIIRRLNLDDQNFFSLRPSSARYCRNFDCYQ